MVSIPKVIGLTSCGFLLCLGLSNAASAADDMKAGQPDRQGGQAGLKGEQDMLKGQDGKEVGLRTDQTTPKAGKMDRGYRIEADVNEQNPAKSSGSADTTDRRNNKTEPGSGSQ